MLYPFGKRFSLDNPKYGSYTGSFKRRFMKKIKVAIIGVGNCATSLIQGIEFYRKSHGQPGKEALGLMNSEIGGYRPEDIEVVCAFDIDKRKVGIPVKKAIFQKPNCTKLITN